MTERYDLLIVGAGPGGSATAHYASRAGLETLLLDRQEFPRDKVWRWPDAPCGFRGLSHGPRRLAR
jgi:menaquinone-9 beta-reductase